MGEILKLIIRNTLRHKLRAALTIVGIFVALFAFTMIRTMVSAWYSGVETSAKDRLIVRNAVSLVFYLPISYRDDISTIPGVDRVGYANWFGGNYQQERLRFAQFAIDPVYLEIYDEIQITPEIKESYLKNRKGILVGEELAERWNLYPGKLIQLDGSIFPGPWEFEVAGVFANKEKNGRSRTMYFHWDYLNERNRIEKWREPDHVGTFAVQVKNGFDPALVAKEIDAKFANSFAETLTESETAFRRGFVSMSSSIIVALNVISSVVLVIMLLVLANTLIMSSRERYREYAILKSIGFTPGRVFALILGESFFLVLISTAFLGLVLSVIFSLPPRQIIGDLVDFFPVFELRSSTVLLAMLMAVVVSVFAALTPGLEIARMKVVDGLRKFI
jgi:putative ABC transport system permease protein